MDLEDTDFEAEWALCKKVLLGEVSVGEYNVKNFHNELGLMFQELGLLRVECDDHLDISTMHEPHYHIGITELGKIT